MVELLFFLFGAYYRLFVRKRKYDSFPARVLTPQLSILLGPDFALNLRFIQWQISPYVLVFEKKIDLFCAYTICFVLYHTGRFLKRSSFNYLFL